MPTSSKRREQRKQLRTAAKTNSNVVAAVDVANVPSEQEIAAAASSHATALEENADIELRGVAGKGRGLFWCPANGGTLRRGTTLLRLQPEMMVPKDELVSVVCYTCFKSEAFDDVSLTCCSDCKLVHYCSAACKQADQTLHTEECKSIKFVNTKCHTTGSEVKDPGTMVRLMARLLWQRKHEDKQWWSRITSLLVHYDETRTTKNPLLYSELLANYLCRARLVGDKDSKLRQLGFPTLLELRKLYTRLWYSSFGLQAPGLPIQQGRALSTLAAMMNHSCVPNCIVHYPMGLHVADPMHIVVLKDLKPGDEITISYINEREPYSLRNAMLQEEYFFSCQCTLCQESQRVLEGKSTFVDPREAILCGRSDCLGWVALDGEENKPRGLCTGCGKSCILDITMVKATLSSAKSLASKKQDDNDPFGFASRLMESGKLFKNLTAIQPPSAYPLSTLLFVAGSTFHFIARGYAFKNEAVDSNKYREESIRMSLLAYIGFEESGILPEGHPIRALILLEASKLLGEILNPEAIQCVNDDARYSDYLTKGPEIASPGPERLAWAGPIAQLAAEELKIGDGEDAKGSVLI